MESVELLTKCGVYIQFCYTYAAHQAMEMGVALEPWVTALIQKQYLLSIEWGQESIQYRGRKMLRAVKQFNQLPVFV
jgi:hypothetical protein